MFQAIYTSMDPSAVPTARYLPIALNKSKNWKKL